MESPEFNPIQPLAESGYSEAQQAKKREGTTMDNSQLTQQFAQPVGKKQKSKMRREKLNIIAPARRDI